MKHISIEEFISNLKSVPSGIEYLEFIENNKILPHNEGEKHHIYPKSICGDNKILYKLSYKNHIIAHIILAISGIQGNFWWQFKALKAITEFTRRQINNLSDIEQIELEEIYHLAELRKLAHKAHGEI